MFKNIIFFIISFAMFSNSYGNNVIQRLDARMQKTNSLVCVGLDPDITKIPASIMSADIKVEDKVFSFLSQVIDITAPHVTCYKIQKAFFDQFESGHGLLKQTVAYIHEKYNDIPVFVDCKIGDTDNTMEIYMKVIFEDIMADGVVINPYMGDDVLEPFMKDPNKVAIVLIQTSNSNAKVVQEMVLANGKMLWEEMLHLTLRKWNINNNLIPVLSGNASIDNYISIRNSIPQKTPILLAGIGLQGGNPMVMKKLLNEDGRGVFVNSSRGILYPYSPDNDNWQAEVLKAVLELKNALNNIKSIKESKFVLLLGPSGSGKSTVIKHLMEMDPRFVYISPFTTRELRDGEKDKIHIELQDMLQLQQENKLLTINNLYGIYYATPKYLIDDALANGQFPILDWPVDKSEVMLSHYTDSLYTIYIEPESLEVLEERLSKDNRDKDGKRFEAGKEELKQFHSGKYDHFINLKVINESGKDKEVAELIYDNIIKNR